MRFKKWPRHPFNDTPRKRAALRKKHQRERDDLPLFADQIAQEQPTEDEEMQRRNFRWEQQQLKDRQKRAQDWRNARSILKNLPAQERRHLRLIWDCAPYPADPSRLLAVLRSFELGKLDIKRPPFPLSKTNSSGARIGDLFAKPELFVSILEARRIADRPDSYPPPKRHAAYHHLQAAAATNKDRDRAMADRVLAATLFLRLGEHDR